MSLQLPYDPHEELSKRQVMALLNCGRAELARRMEDGLRYMRRGDRVWFTRAAIEEYRQGAEVGLVRTAHLLTDDQYARHFDQLYAIAMGRQ